MVTDADLAREWEAECLGQMAYHQKSIGEMNEIREQFPDEWQIEELCRAIIFDETQLIQSFQEEIENWRAQRT